MHDLTMLNSMVLSYLQITKSMIIHYTLSMQSYLRNYSGLNMISGERTAHASTSVICFSLSVAFGIKLHRINSRQAVKSFASLSRIFRA